MFLAQMPTPQLPPLPAGPALERVRGPIEVAAYQPWQLALAMLGGTLFVAAILWLLVRRFKKPPAPTPPDQTALAELDAAAKLTHQDDERFAVLSSLALRRYLEDGLGLRFSARTSEEFLSSLKGNTRLDETFQDKLRTLLASFDRIKFGQKSLTESERKHITDTVKSLIDQAHTHSEKEGGRP